MKARNVVAIAIAVYLLLVFFDRFVLVELLFERIATPFLLALAVALACIGAGSLALRGRRDLALNLVIGVPLFGTICFLVGLLKISSWSMVPLVGIFAGIGAVSAVRRWEFKPCTPAEFTAIALVFVAGFLAAQAPPSTLDELAYHLAVPWTWAKHGRVFELPLNSHSYFPMGVESADLPFLAILGTQGGIASHFLHLLGAIATSVLLFRLARRDGLLTAAVVTTPALAIAAGWSLVDWNLLGVSVALVIALEGDDTPAISAAIAAGLLTKYTFIPVALIAVLVTRRFRGLLPGLAAGSIFFIRNLILTANPLAPFFTALAPDVSHYRAGAFLSDYIFSGRFIDESLGASMLMGCTLAAGALSWILIAAGVLLFLLAPSARILVPFFAIPAARALQPGRVMRVLMAIAVVAQLFLIAFFTERSGVFGLLAGRVPDEQYLALARPSIATVAAVDAALPPNSRTLIVGLSETFWFRHDVRGGGNFDGPRVSHYLDAGSVEALHARLKKDGITHVAVIAAPPPTQESKKIEERETALSPDAQRTLAQTLDRYARSVTQHGNATLFALKP